MGRYIHLHHYFGVILTSRKKTALQERHLRSTLKAHSAPRAGSSGSQHLVDVRDHECQPEVHLWLSDREVNTTPVEQRITRVIQPGTETSMSVAHLGS